MTTAPIDLSSPEARDAARLAAGLDLRTRAWIDGAHVDALDGETFSCVNPATGEELARVAACGAADVDRAVAGARAAFESGVWRDEAPSSARRCWPASPG